MAMLPRPFGPKRNNRFKSDASIIGLVFVSGR